VDEPDEVSAVACTFRTMSDDTSTTTDQRGKPPNLSITLDVDNELTWGELFWFVDQARKSGVSPHDDIPRMYDAQQEFTGFQCWVYPEDLAKP
jgi:hypothetical protein